MTERSYPPEWCSAETMAYLLDMGASTFRDYVARGDLPPGQRLNGVVRWHRERTVGAFEGRAIVTPSSVPANDNADPIMMGIMAHGAKAKARREPASARSSRRG